MKHIFNFQIFMKKAAILLLVSLVSGFCQAQIGGRFSYEFLNLANNARIAGIGGLNVSLKDHDPNLIFSNPGAISDTMIGQVAFNYVPFYTGIANLSTAAGFKALDRTWVVGLQYLNFGSFDQKDVFENDLGTFFANEFALTVGTAQQIGNYSFGANLKLVNSKIEAFNASGVAMDMGIQFKHPKKQFSAGLAVKNVGFSFNNYVAGTPAQLPIDVQMGCSYKPEHMPFRFSLTGHNMYRYDIQYLDPNRGTRLDPNGNSIAENKKFTEQIARHLVFGGELLLSKVFQVRAGYNHMLRKELKVETGTKMSGFSIGFMVKAKAFDIGFTRAAFYAVGARTHLTVIADLNRIIKKSNG